MTPATFVQDRTSHQLGRTLYNDNIAQNIDIVNNENVMYTKNNEDIHQLLSNRLQLPEAKADYIFVDNNIPQNEEIVKNSEQNNSAVELTVQTMYKRNKKNLSTAADVQAPALTSKTLSGTVPNFAVAGG